MAPYSISTKWTFEPIFPIMFSPYLNRDGYGSSFRDVSEDGIKGPKVPVYVGYQSDFHVRSARSLRSVPVICLALFRTD